MLFPLTSHPKHEIAYMKNHFEAINDILSTLFDLEIFTILSFCYHFHKSLFIFYLFKFIFLYLQLFFPSFDIPFFHFTSSIFFFCLQNFPSSIIKIYFILLFCFLSFLSFHSLLYFKHFNNMISY